MNGKPQIVPKPEFPCKVIDTMSYHNWVTPTWSFVGQQTSVPVWPFVTWYFLDNVGGLCSVSLWNMLNSNMLKTSVQRSGSTIKIHSLKDGFCQSVPLSGSTCIWHLCIYAFIQFVFTVANIFQFWLIVGSICMYLVLSCYLLWNGSVWSHITYLNFKEELHWQRTAGISVSQAKEWLCFWLHVFFLMFFLKG